MWHGAATIGRAGSRRLRHLARLREASRRVFSSRADDPYGVLGLKRGASEKEIKAAFRRAALLHHPDRNPNNRAEAEAAFKRASDAYSMLSGKSGSGGAAGRAPSGGFTYRGDGRGAGDGAGGFSREQWEREHQRQFEEMLRQMQRGSGRGFGDFHAGGFPGGSRGFSQGVQVRRTVVTRPDGSLAIRTETITIDSRGQQTTRVEEEPINTSGAEEAFGSFMGGSAGRRRPETSKQPQGFFARMFNTLAERALRAVLMAALRRLLRSAFPPRGPLK